MSDPESALMGVALPLCEAGQHRRPIKRQSDRAERQLRQPSFTSIRSTPAKGVHISLGRPNWIFLTICTDQRGRWLAQASVQSALHDIWKNTATAWLVSDYLLMPDHVHLFCAPRDLKFTIERWMGFWKDRFAKMQSGAGAFQPGGFHHRLRSGESYAQKWQYVRANPVRAGLVKRPEDWPYHGCVHEIRW